MPNQLSKDKVRISYAEDAQLREALDRLAKERGVTLSELVKEVTGEYLAKHVPKPKKGSAKSKK